MADTTFTTAKVYHQQGGDELVAAASGTVTVESGGAIVVESGGILDLQTGAVFKDTSVGITGAIRKEFVSKKAWTGTASTAGGVGFWQAPTGSDIILTGFFYNITAASATAGCVLDIGYTPTSIVTKSDTMIDGLVATGTAGVGVRNITKNAGSNGVGGQLMAAGKWITGTSTGTKATTLAGNIYVRYEVI